LLSTISFQEKHNFINLANGFKTFSKGVGQVFLSPSLNVDYVLFVPNDPFNFISLSQLNKTLNCSITFDNKSFVIHEHGSGRQIGEGYEAGGYTISDLVHECPVLQLLVLKCYMISLSILVYQD